MKARNSTERKKIHAISAKKTTAHSKENANQSRSSIKQL